ncbi:MAG: RNA 3'-terminal phosphate cyclase [Candidatus Hodarchaeota archaeon]
MTDKDYLEIDGSFGEGGGAILRLSAAFSVLYNKPIKIINIRANRSKPGLRLQHLLGLKILAELTGSKFFSNDGECQIGTQNLFFIPNSKFKDKINVNIDTSASIGLLVQPIQIACLGFSNPEKIELTLNGGGTYGKWAPSLSYLANVTYKIYKMAGLKIKLDIKKYGFFPKGGAQTVYTIYLPKNKLKPINLLELGNIEAINGEIILTNHLKGRNIESRIKKSILLELERCIKVYTNINHRWVSSISPGIGLSLWATSDTGAVISSGTILGEKQIPSEKLGKMASNELLKYIKNNIPVDKYLSDQLIPLMAYIKESSSIKVSEITTHTKTNLELLKSFTNRDYEITKGLNHYEIKYE